MRGSRRRVRAARRIGNVSHQLGAIRNGFEVQCADWRARYPLTQGGQRTASISDDASASARSVSTSSPREEASASRRIFSAESSVLAECSAEVSSSSATVRASSTCGVSSRQLRASRVSASGASGADTPASLRRAAISRRVSTRCQKEVTRDGTVPLHPTLSQPPAECPSGCQTKWNLS